MTEDSIGFVGLGAMGAHMVARLIDAGHDLAVFDTRAEAMEPHVARGALACESAGAVADAADTVLVSLPTPDVVRAVAGELARRRRDARLRRPLDDRPRGRRARWPRR